MHCGCHTCLDEVLCCCQTNVCITYGCNYGLCRCLSFFNCGFSFLSYHPADWTCLQNIVWLCSLLMFPLRLMVGLVAAMLGLVLDVLFYVISAVLCFGCGSWLPKDYVSPMTRCICFFQGEIEGMKGPKHHVSGCGGCICALCCLPPSGREPNSLCPELYTPKIADKESGIPATPAGPDGSEE